MANKPMIFLRYMKNKSTSNLNAVIRNIELPEDSDFMIEVWSVCDSDPLYYKHLGLILLAANRLVEASFYINLHLENNVDDAESYLYLSEIAARRNHIGVMQYCIGELKKLNLPTQLIKIEELKLDLMCGWVKEALAIALDIYQQMNETKDIYLLITVICRSESYVLLSKLSDREVFKTCLKSSSKHVQAKITEMQNLVMNGFNGN
jgi:hypothetical protein